jgi:hypothetical protein
MIPLGLNLPVLLHGSLKVYSHFASWITFSLNEPSPESHLLLMDQDTGALLQRTRDHFFRMVMRDLEWSVSAHRHCPHTSDHGFTSLLMGVTRGMQESAIDQDNHVVK